MFERMYLDHEMSVNKNGLSGSQRIAKLKTTLGLKNIQNNGTLGNAQQMTPKPDCLNVKPRFDSIVLHLIQNIPKR